METRESGEPPFTGRSQCTKHSAAALSVRSSQPQGTSCIDDCLRRRSSLLGRRSSLLGRRSRLLVREFHIANVDRPLALHEAARLTLLHGLDVLGTNIDPLNHNLALFDIDLCQLANLALRTSKTRESGRV